MESSGWKGGGKMEAECSRESANSGDDDKVKHVGGVNDQLGGVDPEIDATLGRLSGGP